MQYAPLAYNILELCPFLVFPKFKGDMPAVSSMTTPLRVCMLRIYSASQGWIEGSQGTSTKSYLYICVVWAK